jgi:hypothetical protein
MATDDTLSERHPEDYQKALPGGAQFNRVDSIIKPPPDACQRHWGK